MARPGSQGLDYFPLDVHIDGKLKFIKARFGWEGYGIIIGLFQHVYGQGYWCRWSGDDVFLYSAENRIDEALLINVVKEAFKRNLFSEELYNKYQILTSKGIQKRYAEIVKRRKNIDIVSKYVLIGEALCKHDASIMNTSCKQSASKSTQSKVNRKESKVNKPQTTEEFLKTTISSKEDSKIIQEALKDCREILGLREKEMQDFLTKTYKNPKQLKEAVRYVIEESKIKGQAPDSPVGFLLWAFRKEKTSRETRQLVIENNKTEEERMADEYEKHLGKIEEENRVTVNNLKKEKK